MITLFKYSTQKFPSIFSVAWAIGVQVVGVLFVALTFQDAGAWFGKNVLLTDVLIACCVGMPAGFLLVASRARSLGLREIIFFSLLPLGLAAIYWIVSDSRPDLWLSHVIASFGVGVATTVVYRLIFFNSPILPRVK